MVPIMLMPNTTQINAMAISMGHSSSAYSLEVVIPSGSVSTADTMINCQPQKVHPGQHVVKHPGFQQSLHASNTLPAKIMLPTKAKITALV
jgi:hypothetical protein